MKSLSRLIRITSHHDGHFSCLNCFHSYRTENKLEKHEQECNYDYCYVDNEDNKTLKYNFGEKSLKYHWPMKKMSL